MKEEFDLIEYIRGSDGEKRIWKNLISKEDVRESERFVRRLKEKTEKLMNDVLYWERGVEQMKQLKTLKEIYSPYQDLKDIELVRKTDLKKEAIKWMKESEELAEVKTASWIRYFFNITEEDLK